MSFRRLTTTAIFIGNVFCAIVALAQMMAPAIPGYVLTTQSSGPGGTVTLVYQPNSQPATTQAYVTKAPATTEPVQPPPPGQTVAGPAPTTNAVHRLFGVNLERISPYARSETYIDLVCSCTFDSVAAAGDGKAPIGPDGWPSGDFGVTLYQAAVPSDAGIHTVIFRGSYAAMTVSNGSSILSTAFDSATQTTTSLVQFNPASIPSLWLRFSRTAGARQLQVLRPGCTIDQALNQRFTTRFLTLLAAARPGVIRGMDLLATNGSTQTNWTDRPTTCPSYWQNNGGAPIEDLVGCCNRTGADLWLNIPEQATPDYVRQEAALIARQLNPGAVVYLERGNEVWNTALPFRTGHDFNVAAAVQERSQYGFDSNDEFAGWQRTAMFCAADGAIFRAAIGNRARPVLAGQGANLATLQYGLAWLSAHGGAGQIWGTAIAPYSAITPNLAAGSWQVHPETWAAVQQHAAINRAVGLACCWYECGVDLSSQPSPGNAAGQMQTAMTSLAGEYLSNGAAVTSGPICWFNLCSPYNASGSQVYGLTNDASVLTTPKLLAACAFSKAH